MHRISSFLISLLLAGVASAAETVIVNAGLGVAEVTKDDLTGMFEGKKGNWPSGAKVVLVTQPDAAVHETFLKAYVGKSPSQFATAWKKIVFTGKASAPVNAKSDAEVVEAVAKSAGAVGYISDPAAAAGKAGVTVVTVK
jgi:ABC-type phosphate transport system substrate-binding protein